MSLFENLETLPPDPIMNLPVIFAQDKRENRVNLGIGTYRDAEGRSVIFSAVKKAEVEVVERKLSKEYLPLIGDPVFIESALQLVFGKITTEIVGCQSLGGTGGLFIGAKFLARNVSDTIYIPSSTWVNHKPTFQNAGLRVEMYPYFDFKNFSLEYDKIRQAIQSMPPKSIMLLHGCCHNPTGEDPSFSQWQELSDLILERKIIPFFDLAYQGFGDSQEEDVKAIRYFAAQGHEMCVAASFSKNFTLYNERVGLLAITTRDLNSLAAIKSHLNHAIRPTYSNPPAHGARIISTILNSPQLFQEWRDELSSMRQRIVTTRKLLASGLSSSLPHLNFSHIERQKGFFSFIGLNKNQVDQLRKVKAIHLPDSGRINIAGLNPNNIDNAIESIVSVMHHES